MKRNEIVESLIKEGFTEKTLVKFSDKQLSDLHERIIGEGITKVSSTDIKTQDELKKEKKPFEVYEGNSGEIDESLFGISIAAAMDRAEKKLGRKPSKEEVEKEMDKLFSSSKEDEKSKKENSKPKKKETKEWLKSLAESNFHSFTSKNEIMELVSMKLNEVEVGPNVKKGHNGIPEFMSYDAISNTEVKEAAPTTKPSPTKPKVNPGTKPRTPYSPKPGEKSKPKALKEKENANK